MIENTQNVDIWITGLLVSGIVLLLLEIKIISQGILAFLGSAMLVIAGVILWQRGVPFWGIPVGWIIPLIAMAVISTSILTWLAIKAQQEKVVTGYQGYVGEIAEVKEALNPQGKVFFQGTYWQALSGVPIAAGEKVRVIGADRLILVVEPVSAFSPGHETLLENSSGHA